MNQSGSRTFVRSLRRARFFVKTSVQRLKSKTNVATMTDHRHFCLDPRESISKKSYYLARKRTCFTIAFKDERKDG